MMEKINIWLDAPLTYRRSFKLSGIVMVIYMITAAVTWTVLKWDDVSEWISEKVDTVKEKLDRK